MLAKCFEVLGVHCSLKENVSTSESRQRGCACSSLLPFSDCLPYLNAPLTCLHLLTFLLQPVSPSLQPSTLSSPPSFVPQHSLSTRPLPAHLIPSHPPSFSILPSATRKRASSPWSPRRPIPQGAAVGLPSPPSWHNPHGIPLLGRQSHPATSKAGRGANTTRPGDFVSSSDPVASRAWMAKVLEQSVRGGERGKGRADAWKEKRRRKCGRRCNGVSRGSAHVWGGGTAGG